MAKLLKYFEVALGEVHEWDWKDYVLFIIEALYSTVFPFIAGMLLVQRKQLIWLLMLILPIYLKLNVQKKFEDRKNKKKIYVS